ncbi:MAG: hypothetical protein AAF532_16525 [Planctomycetota bacterium]
MSFTRRQLEMLGSVLKRTRDFEYDCDDVLGKLAEYLETSADETVELNRELLLTQAHLEICPECQEELEALEAACEAVEKPEE